jgi:uncharacterized metal-binding protein YceD (DUF177 family)
MSRATVPGAMPPPEFPRSFDSEGLAGTPAVRRIEAKPEERAALARRLGLVALAALTAELTITRMAGGFVRVDGVLRASVTQTCVVTLDPFEASVEEAFTALFAPADRMPEGDLLADPDADVPEPLDGTRIDLGELVAQQLSLALDPYPKAPGVTFEGASAGEAEDVGSDADESDAGRNPFAALAKLGRPD